MRRISLAAVLAVSFAVCIAASTQAAIVTITATADNLTAGWFKDGSVSYQSLTMPASPNNLKDWHNPDTFTVDLGIGQSWEIIFQVVNDDNDGGYSPPEPGNPGGFLAEMNLGSYPAGPGTSSLLSDVTWEVAVYTLENITNPEDEPWQDAVDSTVLAGLSSSWVPATSYGSNAASDPNIWSPVSGIASGAQWIWTSTNEAGGPGLHYNANPYTYPDDVVSADLVFVKAELHPVPEPGTLLLLGTGLMGLAGYGLRRRKKK